MFEFHFFDLCSCHTNNQSEFEFSGYPITQYSKHIKFFDDLFVFIFVFILAQCLKFI